jgi:hypothetical protein
MYKTPFVFTRAAFPQSSMTRGIHTGTSGPRKKAKCPRVFAFSSFFVLTLRDFLRALCQGRKSASAFQSKCSRAYSAHSAARRARV